MQDIMRRLLKKISVQPDTVVTACMMSSQPSLGLHFNYLLWQRFAAIGRLYLQLACYWSAVCTGIVLLDELLMHLREVGTGAAPVAKKVKTTAGRPESVSSGEQLNAWIALSRQADAAKITHFLPNFIEND
jgi:hypothetical protein